MNININQTELKNAIKKLERLLHKTPIPVLESVLLTADNNEITITANNLVSTLTVNILGDVIESGSILIDKSNFKLIKKLSGILNITSSDNMGLVNINTEEEKQEVVSNTIIIKANRNLKFNSILPEEYPELPKDINEEAFSIPENVFKNNLKIKVFAAKNHFREVFTGVLISENDLVANNTHYLAKYELDINNKCKDQIIIPLESINELDKILDNKSTSELHFYYSKNDNKEMKNIKIIGKGFIYTTRLIEGIYPNYKQVIPNSFYTEVNIENGKLQDTLEFAKDTIQDKNEKIKTVEFGITNQFQVKAEDIDRSMSEILPSEIKGDEMEEIKFNSEYIITILKNIIEKRVTIKFAGRFSPAVFTGEDNQNELYVLVPMRLTA